MLQKVVKYGNSRAVVIPRELLDQLQIQEGDWVNVELRNGGVAIHPVDIVPRLSDEDRRFLHELYQKRRRVFEALGE